MFLRIHILLLPVVDHYDDDDNEFKRAKNISHAILHCFGTFTHVKRRHFNTLKRKTSCSILSSRKFVANKK